MYEYRSFRQRVTSPKNRSFRQRMKSIRQRRIDQWHITQRFKGKVQAVRRRYAQRRLPKPNGPQKCLF